MNAERADPVCVGVYMIQLQALDELGRTVFVREYLERSEQIDNIDAAVSIAIARIGLRKLDFVDVLSRNLGIWHGPPSFERASP
jgi:hypothetical protein